MPKNYFVAFSIFTKSQGYYHFHHHKEAAHPISTYSPFLCSLSLWKPLTCFPSLNFLVTHISYKWNPTICGLLRLAFSRGSVFSRFVHVHTFFSMNQYFLMTAWDCILNCAILCFPVHQLVGIWGVVCFGYFEKCCCECLCTNFCVDLAFQFSWV